MICVYKFVLDFSGSVACDSQRCSTVHPRTPVAAGACFERIYETNTLVADRSAVYVIVTAYVILGGSQFTNYVKEVVIHGIAADSFELHTERILVSFIPIFLLTALLKAEALLDRKSVV